MKGWATTANEMEEGRLTKKRKIIGKKKRAERLIPLLVVSILEIDLLTGSSYCNDARAILRNPEFYLNLFTTRIKHVGRCRIIQESVVRRAGKK